MIFRYRILSHFYAPLADARRPRKDPRRGAAGDAADLNVAMIAQGHTVSRLADSLWTEAVSTDSATLALRRR